MEHISQDQRQAALFIQLVLSLGQSAMIGMGKSPNPFTGKVQIEMEEASHNIELLAAIKERTKGNLSQQEQSIMDQTLTNLRLTYVEEVARQKKNPPEPNAKAETEPDVAPEAESK